MITNCATRIRNKSRFVIHFAVQVWHVHVVVWFLDITLTSIVMPCPVSAEAPAVAVDSNVAEAGQEAHDANKNDDAIRAVHFI